MANTTRATLELTKAGVSFTVHHYTYDPGADRIGMQAAEALGEPARRVLKTLMAEVDGKPVCVIVPSDREVAMKKLAAALGGKHAQMPKPTDAERLTGYHTGCISPYANSGLKCATDGGRSNTGPCSRSVASADHDKRVLIGSRVDGGSRKGAAIRKDRAALLPRSPSPRPSPRCRASMRRDRGDKGV
ncbi:MAG: hypothetical protein KGJ79_03805 [Alphaproteobacteria bacterium]|nr:hypothetical protein [Alphaproteobacteria bacterium]MDE2110244.1 hypothetical protein [Alphaproteobacteria bacterium]MDE2493876.1 hypothetical protein [Alphaproteobacteria bacterium]